MYFDSPTDTAFSGKKKTFNWAFSRISELFTRALSMRHTNCCLETKLDNILRLKQLYGNVTFDEILPRNYGNISFIKKGNAVI